jgi:hypothetical protein
VTKAAATVAFLLAALCAVAWAQTTALSSILARRYTEGERVEYLMKGYNDGNTYEVRITGITRRMPDGTFADEFAWSDYSVNGKPRALAASSAAFRQIVTLAGGTPFPLPELSKAPGLIGPVTDLLTFYADLFLAIHGGGTLQQAGDRFYFSNPVTASWADGNVVVLGEDSIDFDITLTGVDRTNGIAVLMVKHVAPPEPKIKFPAEWMRPPVADTSNNWIQVRKIEDAYIASVGKETFDVELRIRLADGAIVSATMENPVTKITRTCADAALAQCTEARPDPTMRRIEMTQIGRQ